MLAYLAYQFSPHNLTKARLTQLMDAHYDFSVKDDGNVSSAPRNAEEWFESVRRQIAFHRERTGSVHPLDMKGCWLRKAQYFATQYLVKDRPTLEIYLRENGNPPAPCPENFTGLNIWPGHSGSEGIVDLIEFKPEMDSFMYCLGMPFTDKSEVPEVPRIL